MPRTPRTPRLSLRRMLYLALLLPPAVALLNFICAFAFAFAEADQGGMADDAPVFYRGARIHTASGPVIEKGVLVVLQGKVLQVGSEDEVSGAFIEAMRVLTGQVLGGIKFANGENPKGAYGGKNQAPMTRMKLAALQREQLVKAQAYKRQWDNYNQAKAEGKEASAPER